jgi:hypothetical protein
MSEEQKKKLLAQLDALKIFPKSNLVKELQKQIKSKLAKLENKELKTISKETKLQESRESKSSKLKKYHRYLRLIRDNFPDLTYNQIRKQFSERKHGSQVDIPDAVWQNPSP